MNPDDTPAAGPIDPVLAKRERATRLADLGQRAGYILYALALVVFFIGLIGDFSSTVAQVVIASIVVGSIVLAPAIIVSYAVKAAERDDIEHGREIG